LFLPTAWSARCPHHVATACGLADVIDDGSFERRVEQGVVCARTPAGIFPKGSVCSVRFDEVILGCERVDRIAGTNSNREDAPRFRQLLD